MMTPPPHEDDHGYTLSEVTRWLQRMDDGQRAILEKLESMRGDFVHRNEWDLRAAEVDRRLANLEGRRVPWTSVTSAVVALLALAASLHLIG